MALFVNKVQLAGNLTRDPQVRFFADSKAVANFGIAINRRYRTAGGEQRDETTFVDIECWGRTAELVGQNLSKGSSCLIEGNLKLDQWERDGQRRSQLKWLLSWCTSWIHAVKAVVVTATTPTVIVIAMIRPCSGVTAVGASASC